MSNYPYATEPEAVRVSLRSSLANPHVRAVYQTTLKDGPRAYRFASIFEIVDPQTNEHHHFALTISSFDRTKKNGWREQEERRVTIESRDPDELTQLVTFIGSVSAQRFPEADGQYHVLDAKSHQELQDILSAVRRATSSKKVELLKLVFENIEAETISAEDWRDLLKGGAPEVLHSVANAARLIEYRKQYARLKQLVNDPSTKESPLQDLLAANPWMFGSEYSELLERRVWFRGSQLDYMARRSSDGYLEIIEIKTPFTEPLFIKDTSHDCHFPSQKLSKVVGQVIHYLGEGDRARDYIQTHDKVDPLKVRARVIIGRDNDEMQVEALRSFNGHLHRVEVITFDQLLSIARRVLNVFMEEQSLE